MGAWILLVCRMVTVCGDERHVIHRSCFNKIARHGHHVMAVGPPDSVTCPICQEVCDYRAIVQADLQRQQDRNEPLTRLKNSKEPSPGPGLNVPLDISLAPKTDTIASSAVASRSGHGSGAPGDTVSGNCLGASRVCF